MIPKIVNIQSIDQMSYSSYSGEMDCLLKNLPKQSIVIEGNYEKVKTKKLILGKLFHELLENTVAEKKTITKRNHIDLTYIELINKYKSSLKKCDNDLYTSIDFWPEHDDIRNTVNNYNDNDDVVSREVTLKSKDEKVVGIIDEIAVSKNHVKLIEYKCQYDKVALDKKKYIEQIHLYAKLYESNHSKYPNVAFIRGLNDHEFQVNLSRRKSDFMMDRLRSYYDYINEKIHEVRAPEDACSPHKGICNHCGRRYICPVISSKKSYEFFDSSLTIAKFEVIETKAEYGNKVYSISGVGGCLRNQEKYQLQVSNELTLKLNVGGLYLIDDVIYEKDKKKLTVNKNSKIFY